MNRQTLPDSLIASLKDNGLQDISVDILDKLLTDEMTTNLLAEIPIVKTFLAITKTSSAVKDLLFYKKILSFLLSVKDVPQEVRIKEIIKIEDNADYQYNVGEKVLFLIDKIEDSSKAFILGKLFKAVLEEKIDFNEFIRASKAVDILFIDYFNNFINESWTDIPLENAGELVSVGLMNASLKPFVPRHGSTSASIVCNPSELGLKLQKLMKGS